MASFINLHLDIINKQFNRRLEIVDSGTTLRIRDLRMEDSGIYHVTITFTDGETYLTSYNLTVYGKQDPPLQVTGIIDQSVDLSVDRTRPVYKVYWIFQTHIMASFINLHLDIINNQFDKRLEILDNGTTLRIRDLRMEDSGIYSVTITSTDKEEYKTSYNLTVYEPVPAPTIRIEGKNIISDWCNMSLHCSVPTNTSVLSYTWKYRHRDTEYQPYNTGTIIQMSLQNESWDMEFLCIVHNPADQKNVSVHVQDICPDLGGRRLGKTTGKDRDVPNHSVP
ncbi:SLAM family member 5-like [Mixophyes fleayi]|uniref:SLAM family member 5-like n=1 Tax=Mixophyes fleayi TaxID=3061075 RepID=UPI003F4D9393